MVLKILKNKTFLLFLASFILLIGFLVYSKRAILFASYNESYWKDRYEHSQYALPLSERKIGDDGLHAYAGYRIIRGDDPFSINNDKPPAGKYLLGISILLFNNPLIVPFIVGILSLILFWFILNYFVKSRTIVTAATLLLFLDPLYFGQFYIAGLDLFQVFFYLVSFFLLLVVSRKKVNSYKTPLVILAGVSLGIFTEVKPPILSPLAFLVCVLLLYKSGWKNIMYFVAGIGMGIIISYIPFLMMGNSIIDIIRVHKFVASIYLASHVKGNLIAPWTTLFIGKVPSVVNGAMIGISEWTPIWPLLLLNSIGSFFYLVYTKALKKEMIIILLWIASVLLIYTYVPFYARYLVVVLPFFYLLFGFSLSKFSKKIAYPVLILLIFVSLVKYFIVLRPQVDGSIQNITYSYNHHYFRDIYEEALTKSSKPTLGVDEFDYLVRKFLYDADISRSSVEEISRRKNRNTYEVDIKITHYNRVVGPFSENKTLYFEKENGIWKLIWDWDYVVDGYLPGSGIEKKYEFGPRGSIVTEKGAVLARDIENGILILIDPDKVDNENEQSMLNLLAENLTLSQVGIQNTYLENPLRGEYIPIGTPIRPMDEEVMEKIKKMSGVKITPFPNRMFFEYSASTMKNAYFSECCSRIYSSANYVGVEDAEREYEERLAGNNGGEIYLVNMKGKKIIFSKAKKIGENIVLK